MVTKQNIAKFRCLEHLVKIIPYCLDFQVIRKCLHILFSKISDDEISFEDIEPIKDCFTSFSHHIYYLYQHYNLANFFTSSIVDVF